MGISNISGIPYGRTFELHSSKLEATKELVSDGKVDDSFSSQSEEFIPQISDPRVQDFVAGNISPGEGWKPHELGGFDSDTQSLFIENERVVLRSNTEEDGKLVQHRIEAPYNSSTGQVFLESSTEGFRISDSEDGGVSFKIPLGDSSKKSDTGLSDPFGWNSEVQMPEAQPGPLVRPGVQEAIDFLSGAEEIRVIHTTRSMPPVYSKGFAAGRHAVGAKKGEETRTFIMRTEGLVPHLGEVIPGQTRVDGFVAEVGSPYDNVKESSMFNEAELKALTLAMMKDKPSEAATDFAAAIYANGDPAKYAQIQAEATS